MNWQDYLSFRKMITPMIIQVLFWIGVAASVIGGIIYLISSMATGFQFNSTTLILSGLCLGPITILLGILMSRIYAELLILFFRMNETLTEIKEALQKQN